MKNLFVLPNDPILDKIARKIPQSQINSPKIRGIIKTMLKVAYGEQKDKTKPVMVGLAAPQIGKSIRIILVDVKANGKGMVGDLKVYINPKITWASKEKKEWYEGCYSTSRVCGIVHRPISIKVQAFTFEGVAPLSRCDLNISGYVARIFQHEIDHLNGIRFPDLIKDPNKLHWVNKNEFKLYRNKQAWRNWLKKCSFKKWQEIKNPLLKKA